MDHSKLLLYVSYAAMLLLGQIVSLLWIKIPSLKKQAKIGNQMFIWKDWWAADWNLVVGTFAFGTMLMIGLDQFLHYAPSSEPYLKWIFGFVGLGGSTVVMAKLSKYGKFLDGQIDDKTNQLDAIMKTGNVNAQPQKP